MKKTITSTILMGLSGTFVCTVLLSGYTYFQTKNDEVTIGTQVWNTRNLNVSSFRNGDPIPEVKNAEEWKKYAKGGKPAWCYYNNDPANGTKYGKLYNWYAVMDSRGLAPSGWHIPSDEEWKTLMNHFGGLGPAHEKLKSKSGWYVEPNPWNLDESNGDNSSGFNALPGGTRDAEGTFDSRPAGKYAYWWSSSAVDSGYAYSFYLRTGNDLRTRNQLWSSYKEEGLSVRCIKNK